MTEHLSDLEFDAIRLGSGAPEDFTHLKTCEVCQSRQVILTKEAEEFAVRFNPAGLAAETLARIEAAPEPSAWRRWLRPATAAMSGLGVIAVAAVALLNVGPPQDPDVRRKGELRALEVFVRSDSGPRPLQGAVAPDARLGVRIDPQGRRFVRLLWESKPKVWDALYPNEDAESWTVRDPTWLSREVVLDGAPQTERLGAVICKSAVSHAEAKAALVGQLREDCRVETARIEKR